VLKAPEFLAEVIRIGKTAGRGDRFQRLRQLLATPPRLPSHTGLRVCVFFNSGLRRMIEATFAPLAEIER